MSLVSRSCCSTRMLLRRTTTAICCWTAPPIGSISSRRTLMTGATAGAYRMIGQRLVQQGGALVRVTMGAGAVVTAAAAVGGTQLYYYKSEPSYSANSSMQRQHWLWWNNADAVGQETVVEGQEQEAIVATASEEAEGRGSESSTTSSTVAVVMATSDDDDDDDNNGDDGNKDKNNNNESLWNRFFGSASSTSKTDKDESSSSPNNTNDSNSRRSVFSDDHVDNEDETTLTPGNNRQRVVVVVELDEEVLDSLPIMSLQDVQNSRRHDKNQQQLLVTYDGIVYDVTQFVHDHPGGSDLILTAAGLDLDHFFTNYTIHGMSTKAAQWLAPLAVGKLTTEDAKLARELTTSEIHVERRHKILQRNRRRILVIASTLPIWMCVRNMISWIGWFVPTLGRLLANWTVPVTVPGYTRGSERLVVAVNHDEQEGTDEESQPKYKVAIIGGGIAGCGAAWACAESGFDVTLYEARKQISGNARTFTWDFSDYRGYGNQTEQVESCVSVTAWPTNFYKNYTCLLDCLQIETVHQPLSWFINSKVPGYEGTLWEADPTIYEGSLRKVFENDFAKYKAVVDFSRRVTNFLTLRWTPWRQHDTISMYDSHQGFGVFNPLNVVPLYSLFKLIGGSDAWWNIVFTPQYTASFLVDELRPFPAVFGPLIEAQIPLCPDETNSWQGPSKLSPNDCNITTCVTWKDAGKGIRQVFDKLVKDCTVKEDTRVREIQVLPNGQKRVYDEYDNYIDVDRVIFACPANAVGNIYKQHTNVLFANTIFNTPVYADDHHPSTGHMHAIVHSDGTVIPKEVRDDCLKRASNYVEVTQRKNDGGTLNIENQYNFGVQTPGPGIYDLPLSEKPVMLIGHALGEGKSIDPMLIRGTGNHARAHPLYSGWNIAAQLSLRLVQGRDGIYYCSNWTTPGNCHDMSLLSGIICAHAIGAKYPFEDNVEAKKDFHRLRDLMGI